VCIYMFVTCIYIYKCIYIYIYVYTYSFYPNLKT
jgi:hypothetical protein